MKRWRRSILAVAALVVAGTFAARAILPDYIEMQSDYIWTAINSAGTIGVGNGGIPGLIFDPSGNGNFDQNTDYVEPGTPWEIFTVKGDIPDQQGSWIYTNNNSGYDDPDILPTSMTDLSSPGVHYVSWSGEVRGLFGITNEYRFEDGDRAIYMRTRIWALDDGGLENVRFLRAVDPDQDSNAGGGSYTENYRGFGSIPPEQIVSAFGPVTGRIIRLTSSPYMDERPVKPSEASISFISMYDTNTGITDSDPDWSEDPDDYLAAQDDGNGDNAIGLAFDIGYIPWGDQIGDIYALETDGETWLYYAYIFDQMEMVEEFPPLANELLNTNSRLIALELASRGRASQAAARRAMDQQALLRLAAPEGVAGPDDAQAAESPDLTLQGWVGGFGHWDARESTGTVTGSDTETFGSLAGIDKTWCNFTAGLAAGTSRTVMDLDNNDSSEAESIIGAVYSTWTLDRFFVDSSFQFAWHEIDETYDSRNSEAEFNAQTYALYLGAGMDNVLCSECVFLTPEAGVLVGYYRAESHREQAQQNQPGLDVDAYDRWSYQTRLGATLGLNSRVSDTIVLKPSVKLFWLHEFNDDEDQVGYTFGGSGPLSARYRGPVDDALEAGLSLVAEIKERYEIGIGVNGDIANDYDSYGVDAHIGVRF